MVYWFCGHHFHHLPYQPLDLGYWLFLFCWPVAYRSFFYLFLNLTIYSSTMGMRMTGIKFRQRHNRPFDGLYALLHTIGTMIAYATSLQIVSIILMLITSRK